MTDIFLFLEVFILAVDVDEDERRSADESIDSSELSNRLAVLVPTAGESEENTRDCEMPLAENAGGTTVESRSTNFEDARAEETGLKLHLYIIFRFIISFAVFPQSETKLIKKIQVAEIFEFSDVSFFYTWDVNPS